MRVANLNMADPNQQCPENLRLSYTNPIRLCGRRTDSQCDSVKFTTYGVQYQQVCGRVRGYQFASPDAFNCNDYRSCPTNIDVPYVDGVSITHGENLREHIWTYMQLHFLETKLIHPLVHVLLLEHHPLLFWALTSIVSLELTLVHGSMFSTLMIHCGMDKIAMVLSIHAVILQTFRGSATLSQVYTNQTGQFMSLVSSE